MRAEEQLKLVYMTIAELKDQNAKLVDAVAALGRVLESGDVEVSNNISEQSVRKLKMNLKIAGNIGSESSAADNAFMYSVIESCWHNDIDPGKYISFLLGKLKTARDGEDLTDLLTCYCGLLTIKINDCK